MTARAKRGVAPARRSPGNTRLRAQDLAHLAAAEALRPGVPAADVRSEVIALGRAAMEAGGRIEPARAVLPTPTPAERAGRSAGRANAARGDETREEWEARLAALVAGGGGTNAAVEALDWEADRDRLGLAESDRDAYLESWREGAYDAAARSSS